MQYGKTTENKKAQDLLNPVLFVIITIQYGSMSNFGVYHI